VVIHALLSVLNVGRPDCCSTKVQRRGAEIRCSIKLLRCSAGMRCLMKLFRCGGAPLLGPVCVCDDLCVICLGLCACVMICNCVMICVCVICLGLCACDDL